MTTTEQANQATDRKDKIMKGNMKRETIPASEAEAGMFIVGLDNGYIFDVEASPDLPGAKVSCFRVEISGSVMLEPRGNYNSSFGEGLLLITFHDANGDENYLLLQPDLLLTVEYGTD